MSTDQSLIRWNTRWTMIAGIVVCGECLNRQSLSQCNQPFDHDADCTNAETAGTTPWADRHDILDFARG